MRRQLSIPLFPLSLGTITLSLVTFANGAARAEGYLDQWHLEQATKALAQDRASPTRLESREGQLVWRIPGHAQYAEHCAYSAYRVLDPSRERVVEGPRAKEARALLVKSRRQELLSKMRVAEKLTTLSPSREWVGVSRHYAASQDVPYDGLPLVKMFRMVRRDLQLASRGYATVPVSEALSEPEGARLRQLQRQLGAKLRKHDRASFFGRIRRSWKAASLRSERRIRDQVRRELAARK